MACPAGRRGGGCWRCPKGGLPSLSPAYPAFSLLCCPHPPVPLPVGKGDIKVIFMQGASPLASPRAEPMVRRITERKRFPASGAARVQPPGTCMARLVSAASGLMPGCRGRSPRRNKLWISPFPLGRGGGGMGERKQAKGRVSRRQRRHAPPLGTANTLRPRQRRGTPSAGYPFCWNCKCRPGSTPGMQGAKPLA